MGKGIGDIAGDIANPFGAAVGAVAGPTVGGIVNPVGMAASQGAKQSAGGKNSAPAPPDFTQAAQQQAASSQQAVNQQTQANRPDQTNAFGASSTWTTGPDGTPIQTSSLGGPLASGVSNLEGQIGSQGALGTGDQARDQAINATYGQLTSRLDPQWAQTEEQTKSQLAGQGLDPGSEAYDNAIGNMDRAKTDAYSTAANNAVTQGLQAQQATFGENLQAQNNPYQQLGALNGLTGQQSFQGAGQAQPTQYLPAATAQYGGAQNQFGAQQAQKNGLMSGAASLAPLALAASDERLKMNIERLPIEALPGVPFATWEWKKSPGKRHRGVIAQDLQKVAPERVHQAPDGHLMVDYSFLET